MLNPTPFDHSTLNCVCVPAICNSINAKQSDVVSQCSKKVNIIKIIYGEKKLSSHIFDWDQSDFKDTFSVRAVIVAGIVMDISNLHVTT